MNLLSEIWTSRSLKNRFFKRLTFEMKPFIHSNFNPYSAHSLSLQPDVNKFKNFSPFDTWHLSSICSYLSLLLTSNQEFSHFFGILPCSEFAYESLPAFGFLTNLHSFSGDITQVENTLGSVLMIPHIHGGSAGNDHRSPEDSNQKFSHFFGILPWSEFAYVSMTLYTWNNWARVLVITLTWCVPVIFDKV